MSKPYEHLSDIELAGKVRMLMRSDLDHELTVVAARDRIVRLSTERDSLLAACRAALVIIDRHYKCHEESQTPAAQATKQLRAAIAAAEGTGT